MTRHKLAVVCHLPKIHGESTRGITETSAWLVAVQHLGLRIKVLEPRYHLQQWYVVGWQVEVDLSERLSCHLGKVLVSDSLKEGFGDICSAKVPTIPNGFGNNKLLRAPRAGTSIPINVGLLLVLEASNGEPCTDGPHGCASFGRHTSTGITRGYLPFKLDDPTNINDVASGAPRLPAKALELGPSLEFLKHGLLDFGPVLFELGCG